MRNKSILEVLVIAGCGTLLLAGSAQATVEEMNGTIGSWDRLDWVAGSFTDENDADSDSYGWPDSVTFAQGGGGAQHIQVYEAYIGGAVHLEKDNVDTDAGVRIDSSFYQGGYGGNLDHWGMGVGIYFDENNYIHFRRIRDGGGGLKAYKTEGGTTTKHSVYGGYGFDGSWAMQGLELTPTEIKFYSSEPGAGVGGAANTYDSVDYDTLMTMDLSGSTMARPASFAGTATILVGKGYSQVGGDPLDSQWDLVSPKVVSIDSTRLTVVPEPASLALILAGGLVAFAARRRRS